MVRALAGPTVRSCSSRTPSQSSSSRFLWEPWAHRGGLEGLRCRAHSAVGAGWTRTRAQPARVAVRDLVEGPMESLSPTSAFQAHSREERYYSRAFDRRPSARASLRRPSALATGAPWTLGLERRPHRRKRNACTRFRSSATSTGGLPRSSVASFVRQHGSHASFRKGKGPQQASEHVVSASGSIRWGFRAPTPLPLHRVRAEHLRPRLPRGGSAASPRSV